MEFKLKTGPQGHVYFPKRVREVFGDKLNLLPDNFAGAIYPEDANIDEVISSLQVIIEHLTLLAKCKQREVPQRNE
jgi:hypothetical protein